MKKKTKANAAPVDDSIVSKEFFEALASLEKERGIKQSYMIEKIQAALAASVRKEYELGNDKEAVQIVVRIDTNRQEVHVFRTYTVVETVTKPSREMTLEQARAVKPLVQLEETVEIEIKPKAFGRVAAKAAKDIIIQAIRTAESGRIADELRDKMDTMVSAVVIRVDPGTSNATVEIGKNEMVLFQNEQIPTETLQPGDRIKVYIAEKKRSGDNNGENGENSNSSGRAPSVMISRKNPGLVRRLMELEVPELKDGTVEIKAIAREAGSRTKIAVISHDEKVDPVGACIGPKGARKNNVTNELCGEKIDIVPYSEDPIEFIRAALAPATVDSVYALPDGNKAYRAIVADDQLSLAIGKEGQNARLAARLTGSKIDIKSRRSLLEAKKQEEARDTAKDAGEDEGADA